MYLTKQGPESRLGGGDADRYSPIQHLALAVFLNHDPARTYMAMFTAYFDASGHPDATGEAHSLFVSGFVASVEKWLRFETEWKALLNRFGITSPFHMTDFEARQGQYKGLTAEDREAFRAEAIHIITSNTNKAFSVGVVVPALRRLFEEYEVPESAVFPRNPYPWCAMRVSGLVRKWMRNRLKAGTIKPTDNMEFVFQQGDKHRGEFEKFSRRVYRYVPLFKGSSDFVPFQACDYLAWEHRYFLSRRYDKPTPPPRPSNVELARRIAFDSSIYADWSTFERHAVKSGWPKRTSLDR